MNIPRLLTYCIIFSWLTALVGCASTPKPTSVEIALVAATSANPDARSRPSPVVVRLFELKSLAAFGEADFFSLWERDKATLGGELNGRDEYTLRPGESVQIKRLLQPDTLYVGAIAGFRDLEHAQWRATVETPSRKVSTINLRVTGKTISLEAK